MKQDFCVLIMAGGKGTRFWPKSTEEKPKQFINLIGNQTMIQMTTERIKKILPIEKIFVVTGQKYVDILKEQIPDLPDRNVIIEPIGRNTAPCILLSTLYIKQIYGNCNIAVLPSDHLIKNEEGFLNEILKANDFARNNAESIVTIGVTPDRPETGYGYIKYNKNDIGDVIKVEKFVEKPDLETAKKYLDSQEYLWNAGMFIFNTNYMLKELEKNYTNTFNLLKQLPNIGDSNYSEVLNKIYPEAENISIDYAVIEKSPNIYVIPAEFAWDDIGTWKSLERYILKDENSNIVKGKAEMFNSKNNIIYSGDKKVIFVNVDDMFLIDSDECIVVGKKEEINKIHEYRNFVN